MSMGGEGHAEVGDQYVKFVPLSTDKINTTKKDYLYDDIFQGGIK